MRRNISQQDLYEHRNTYCVQYMGINDDRLEVLTRRVNFGKELWLYLDAKQYHKLPNEYLLKVERKPQKLAPIPKKKDPEPEPKSESTSEYDEPVIEEEPIGNDLLFNLLLEVIKQEPPKIIDSPEPKVHRFIVPSDDEDEPLESKVTKPVDDREDFNIPVENLKLEEPPVKVQENKIEAVTKPMKSM